MKTSTKPVFLIPARSRTQTKFIITYLQGLVDMKLCHMPPTADLNNIRAATIMLLETTSTHLRIEVGRSCDL